MRSLAQPCGTHLESGHARSHAHPPRCHPCRGVPEHGESHMPSSQKLSSRSEWGLSRRALLAALPSMLATLPLACGAEPSPSPAITHRVYFDVGVCDAGVNRARTLGDTVACEAPAYLGRMTLGAKEPFSVHGGKGLMPCPCKMPPMQDTGIWRQHLPSGVHACVPSNELTARKSSLQDCMEMWPRPQQPQSWKPFGLESMTSRL